MDTEWSSLPRSMRFGGTEMRSCHGSLGCSDVEEPLDSLVGNSLNWGVRRWFEVDGRQMGGIIFSVCPAFFGVETILGYRAL